MAVLAVIVLGAATTRTPTGALDRFEPRTDEAAIVVRAGEAVPGTTTIQYAQGIRQTQEAFGVTLGPVHTIEVGDRFALEELLSTWDWNDSA